MPTGSCARIGESTDEDPRPGWEPRFSSFHFPIEEVIVSIQQQSTRVAPAPIEAEQLHGLIDAIAENPPLGQVSACVTHRWTGGFGVEGRVAQLTEGGETVSRAHRFRTDWPEPFGRDRGPTPGAESVLATVGACVATTWAAKAALAGVAIEELEVTTEGRVDLQGLFELDEAVTPRFAGITVTVSVRSEAEPSVLEALGLTVSRTSPAYDALANPVPIELKVEARS
jgi:uncharacterized OsmC-like protein